MYTQITVHQLATWVLTAAGMTSEELARTRDELTQNGEFELVAILNNELEERTKKRPYIRNIVENQ